MRFDVHFPATWDGSGEPITTLCEAAHSVVYWTDDPEKISCIDCERVYRQHEFEVSTDMDKLPEGPAKWMREGYNETFYLVVAQSGYAVKYLNSVTQALDYIADNSEFHNGYKLYLVEQHSKILTAELISESRTDEQDLPEV